MDLSPTPPHRRHHMTMHLDYNEHGAMIDQAIAALEFLREQGEDYEGLVTYSTEDGSTVAEVAIDPEMTAESFLAEFREYLLATRDLSDTPEVMAEIAAALGITADEDTSSTDSDTPQS